MRKSTGDVLLAWPLASHVVTAGWQYSDGSAHNAIDLRASVGTPVFAAEGGTVDWVQKWNGVVADEGNQTYGNLVRILHQPYNGGRLQTYYAHLNAVKVSQGQAVQEGELIGFAGNTGNSFGSHLHFEVRLNGVRKNPLNWLDSDFTTAGDHVRLGNYTSVSRDEQKPPGALKKMLDISKHQSSFNAATAKAQGISTTICRCAYATSKDICWDTFAPAVQNAWMKLMAYGFLTAHYTSKASSFAQHRRLCANKCRRGLTCARPKDVPFWRLTRSLRKAAPCCW